MIKAVIFDMDGLIIDTESIQSKAFETIIKCYGKKPILNKEGIVHTVGITEKQNWILLKKKYKIRESAKKLMERKSLNKINSHIIKSLWKQRVNL